VGRRLADLFHGRPRLQAGALLAGPVGWLVIGYLGSLAILLVTSLWTLGELSGEIERDLTLDNFRDIFEQDVYRSVAGRTLLIAALVTLTDIVLAFPIAFYMAKIATPRIKAVLVVAVLMPLWSAYLVKVYASNRSGPPTPAMDCSPSGW
jgi:putative spermidine/putrescine transport system permease protein